MRKKAKAEPKRRGAPTKPRRNYKLLHLRWEVFKRNNPSLTHSQAAAVFLRKYNQWIEGDLAIVIGSYTRLRNAADGDGRKEREREGEQRRKTWHVGGVGIKGQRKLLTGPLVEAQQAYLLTGFGSNRSLSAPRG